MRKLMLMVVMTLVSGVAFAATTLPTGKWTYAGGDSQIVEMEGEVDKAVDEMSFVMRPFARPKLKEICAPWKRLEISRSGDDVTVATDAGELTSPLGKTVTRTIDGDELKVRRELKGDLLVARVWSEEGGRRNTFRKVGDTIVVKSTITSPKLPEPVTFRFTYR